MNISACVINIVSEITWTSNKIRKKKRIHFTSGGTACKDDCAPISYASREITNQKMWRQTNKRNLRFRIDGQQRLIFNKPKTHHKLQVLSSNVLKHANNLLNQYHWLWLDRTWKGIATRIISEQSRENISDAPLIRRQILYATADLFNLQVTYFRLTAEAGC